MQVRAVSAWAARVVKKSRVLEVVLVFLSLCLLFDAMRNHKSSQEATLQINEQTASVSLSSPVNLHDNHDNGSSTTRHVLVLGYQRCGSSLMGLLFNSNPSAFFLFEPADGVYSALYGTVNGWNVPTDIFNFANGSYREIPSVEKQALSSTLNNLLTCNIRSVPTEVLTHSFMGLWLKRQRRVGPFLRCTSKQHVNTNCNKHIKSLCPTRFGKDLAKSEKCRMLMWDVRAHATDYNMTHLDSVIAQYRRNHSNRTLLGLPIPETISHFRSYHECMYNATKKISKCYRTLEDVCNNSTIRSIKTVRVTMDTAHSMMQALPSLRVVHVMRDPRAVGLSRLKQPSFHGIKSGKDVAKEAQLYCDRALRDVQLAQELSHSYPQSFQQIIYETLTANPEEKMEQLYQFLTSSVPIELREWLKNTQDSRNSTSIAQSWMSQMTFELAHTIDTTCHGLRQAVGNVWV